MTLLHDIQQAILQENTDLGPILLKVRLLAARLKSQPLEDWVKYESEGYPRAVPVPSYRVIAVRYTGTFSGAFGSRIDNAPIPPALVEKFAGKRWNSYEMRQSAAAVDQLLASEGDLGINAADLILLLQGKVYEDFACNAVTGTISRTALAELRHLLRSRLLELTIELEKAIPDTGSLTAGGGRAPAVDDSAVVTRISQQVIYGNVASVVAAGENSAISVVVGERDLEGLIASLEMAGIPEADAKELGTIIASEEPQSRQEPLGDRARKWVAANMKKAVTGVWKAGVMVAMDVIKEAALKYYGLK